MSERASPAQQRHGAQRTADERLREEETQLTERASPARPRHGAQRAADERLREEQTQLSGRGGRAVAVGAALLGVALLVLGGCGTPADPSPVSVASPFQACPSGGTPTVGTAGSASVGASGGASPG